ncbi:MAG TPA: BTAD domain-containing putative transcriptional regulator [Gemmatimonadaceae bacterium]
MGSPDYQQRQVLRLMTLGGLAVTDGDRAPLAVSPPRRRLALLATVAASGDLGISRDKLLFFFWPDGSEERARHALTQTLYALRRDLGGAEILAGSTELRLDRDVMVSDVGQLRDALARGDLESAAGLYAGPFLDGVFLPGLPDFERWVEEERSRIARQVSVALESLAESAERGGDAVAAEHWWRRLATLDQLNARYAVRLMRSLAALGDRAGAIRHARVHEALVSQQLGGQPDPAVTALAARLLHSPAAAVIGPTSDGGPEPTAKLRERQGRERLDPDSAGAPTRDTAKLRAEQGGERLEMRPAANGSPPQMPDRERAHIGDGARGGQDDGERGARDDGARANSRDDTQSHMRRPRPRHWATLVGGALLATAMIGYALVRTPPISGALAHESEQVLIADVENSTGDPVFDRSLTVALSAGLMQADRVALFSRLRVRETLALMGRKGADTVIDEALGREIAQRAGVRLLVVPAIARFDSTYELSARIVDATTGEVAAIERERAPRRADVLDALDHLSRDLRRSFGETILSLRRTTVPLPRATTSSLEALKLYADGIQAFNRGDNNSAVTLYRAALERDSNFARAHASLGVALYWANDRPAGERHFRRALALIDRLSDRERFLVRAQVAGWRGDRAQQIDILSAYLLRYSNDVDARSQLAYAYLRARRFEESRDLYLRILAVDSTGPGNIINLATAYSGLHQPELAVAAYRRAFALDSTREVGGTLNIEYGGALVESGRLDEARATFQKMVELRPSEQARGHRSLAYLDMYEGKYAAAAEELADAILLDRVLGYDLSEVRDRLLRSLTVSELGDQARAHAELDEIWRIFHSAYLEPTMLAWIGKAEAREADLPRARELLDSLRARANAGNDQDHASAELLAAEIDLANGRAANARPRLELALKLDSNRYVLESVAYGAERRGDMAEALRLYAALGDGVEFGWEGQRPWELAPYHLGLLEERVGDTAAARAAYQKFVARWPGADPELVALADARRRLAAMH